MKTCRMFFSLGTFPENLAVGTLALALLLAMAASYPHVARAATTITVTVCSDGTETGTLRDAIAQANSSSGDTINFSFSSPCTILLGSRLPQITQGMTINGPGESSLVLDGSGSNQVLLVYCVSPHCIVNISGLTIQNGRAGLAPAIEIEQDNVTLSHVTVKNNTTTGGGAAVAGVGGSILTLDNVTFSNNTTASTSSAAAALFGDSLSTLSLNAVTFITNTTAIGAGAMSTWHAATLNNVTFTDNTTTGSNGGAISSNGTLTITNSVFTNNAASAYEGGAIYAGSNAPIGTIENTTFTGNTASFAAALEVGGSGTLTVTNTSFMSNIASAGGGGILNNGTLRLTNVTFGGNQATTYGGGIYNNGGQTTVTNATFDNNSANSAGSALFNSSGGTATVVNSTIAENSNRSAIGGYSGITLKNTIVTNNSAGNCSLFGGGTITDGGGNLNWAGYGKDCPGAAADPKLGTLANNGGSVQTRELLAGSGAINAGNSSTCAAAVSSPTFGAGGVDARGLPRRSGVCDIGAFEAQPANVSVGSGSSPQSALVNTAFPVPLKAHVTDANTNALGGVVVTYAAPSSGPSAGLSATAATSNTNGDASVTATANGTFGGPYNVAATAGGLTPINFALTNTSLSKFLPLLRR